MHNQNRNLGYLASRADAPLAQRVPGCRAGDCQVGRWTSEHIVILVIVLQVETTGERTVQETERALLESAIYSGTEWNGSTGLQMKEKEWIKMEREQLALEPEVMGCQPSLYPLTQDSQPRHNPVRYTCTQTYTAQSPCCPDTMVLWFDGLRQPDYSKSPCVSYFLVTGRAMASLSFDSFH